ncbi:MAG: hypothetical protein IPL63_13285 [Saprospiraceae bacterium]|nr:hypothetical protein [Saprospiraceae bacterium]
MQKIHFSLLLFLFAGINTLSAQKVKVAAIGFYNVENLFDTVDDTLIDDKEFLPDGARAWTEEKYNEKSANMAYVISQIATELSPVGVSVLGLAEIENRKVVEDLVKQPSLASRNYQIIHFDSPDKRGWMWD